MAGAGVAVTDPAEVDATAERILTSYRTFAVVGLSADPSRPSHGVAAYLQAAGYRVIRLTWRRLVDEPHAVVAGLAAALVRVSRR